MNGCKITVVKKQAFQEIGDICGQRDVKPCQLIEEGQEFITYSFSQPDNFPCGWAWNDISKIITVFLCGGNFSSGLYEGAMQDENTMIACCTDPVRPVVFKIERI